MKRRGFPLNRMLSSVQSNLVAGVTRPSFNAPAVATILKVEPGSTRSAAAMLRCFSSGVVPNSLRSKDG